MKNLVKQEDNKPLRDKKGRLLLGYTANKNGRPKGTSLKEYKAQKFREMTDEEKEGWLKDVAKELQWRMAEGNPASEVQGKDGLPLIIQIAKEIAEKNEIAQSTDK